MTELHGDVECNVRTRMVRVAQVALSIKDRTVVLITPMSLIVVSTACACLDLPSASCRWLR